LLLNTDLFKIITAEAAMRTRVCVLIGGIVLLALVVAPVTESNAEWAVSFQDKTVAECQSGVQVNLTVAWDLPLTGLTIPVIVRSVAGGSFWMGTLPSDIPGTTVGVTWDWSNPGWATINQEFRPGVPDGTCATAGDLGYDGVAPDHFAITAAGAGTSTPPEPGGRVILTFSFDVNSLSGDFEFDTACFSSGIPTIFMVDDQFPPMDHGPLGTGEATFAKGIITVLSGGMCPLTIGEYTHQSVEGLTTEALSNTWNGSTYYDPDGDYARFFLASGPGEVDFITGEWTWTPGCDDYGEYRVEIEVSDELHANCGQGVCVMNILGFDVSVGPGCCFCGEPFGDLNCDGTLNPQDVILLIWEVYRGQCGFCYPDGWYCPNPMADVDCNETVNPVDVVYYVNRVYKGLDIFCFPCPE